MKLSRVAQIDINPEDINGVPQVTDPQSGLNDIMGWVFILVVAVSTIVIIIAGISFITSQGDPQKTKNARNTIIYAVVGIIIAALATSIIRFVADNI